MMQCNLMGKVKVSQWSSRSALYLHAPVGEAQLDSAHLSLNRYPVHVQYSMRSSSPACPCLYLRMVAQNGWFPDIIKVKKKRQFVVLTMRTQNLVCGVGLPFCWRLSILGKNKVVLSILLFLLMYLWLNYLDHWVHFSDQHMALISELKDYLNHFFKGRH